MPGNLRYDDLDKLLRRWQVMPAKVAKAIGFTMRAALDVIHSEVPSYPERLSSSYERTGTLGRSLGVSMGGSPMGKPDIHEIRRSSRGYRAKFGTRLEYGPHVIGSRAFQQIQPFKRYWWTLPDTVAKRAEPRLQKLVEKLADSIAKWANKNP
jgi:hypothetical protein